MVYRGSSNAAYISDPSERGAVEEKLREAERSACEVCGKRVSNRGHAQWSHRRSKFHREAVDRRSGEQMVDTARENPLARNMWEIGPND